MQVNLKNMLHHNFITSTFFMWLSSCITVLSLSQAPKNNIYVIVIFLVIQFVRSWSHHTPIDFCCCEFYTWKHIKYICTTSKSIVFDMIYLSLTPALIYKSVIHVRIKTWVWKDKLIQKCDQMNLFFLKLDFNLDN